MGIDHGLGLHYNHATVCRAKLYDMQPNLKSNWVKCVIFYPFGSELHLNYVGPPTRG